MFVNLDTQMIIGLCIRGKLMAAAGHRPTLSRFYQCSSQSFSAMFWNDEPPLNEGHRRAASSFSKVAQTNFDEPNRFVIIARDDKRSPTLRIRENVRDLAVAVVPAIGPKLNSQGTIISNESIAVLNLSDSKTRLHRKIFARG